MISKLAKICLLWVLGGAFAQALPAQVVQQVLGDSWEFAARGSETFYPTDIPGTAQQFSPGNYPELFHPEGEAHSRSQEGLSWVYRTSFTPAPDLFAKPRIQLSLSGIDTYGEVFLNGNSIGKTANMFRTYSFDISQYLVVGKNSLEIRLASTYKTAKKRLKKYPLKLPAGNDDSKVKVSPFVRKAPFHFGWDWGPRLLTTGIWEAPVLVGYDQTQLSATTFHPQEITTSQADYSLKLHTESLEKEPLKLICTNLLDGTPLIHANFLSKAGRNTTEFPFSIRSPQFWWPNGYGKPFLYPIEVVLSGETGEISRDTFQLGIRTIEWVQEPDEIGQSFYFRVNGKKIFLKGANYIPPGHNPQRWSFAWKKQVLESALDANMNTIRVWGGGRYETDEFYAFCDQNGLLVWQDFMFACSMYPASPGFLANIETEISQQVQRIQSHPSLLLFCGNNEIEVALDNWGWQKAFKWNAKKDAKIRKDYHHIFDTLIPRIIAQNAPAIPYLPSSPSSNWGKKENFDRGNMHYWGVWHGGDSIDAYADWVPRFMSEYGFQSWPEPRTFHSWIPDSSLSLSSPAMQARQKSYKGNTPIFTEMERWYGTVPEDYPSFQYLSQLVQAEAYGIAIRNHRKDPKRCGGTLYWQLNDCWPGPSWSTMDAFGNFKAAHYSVRKAYAPQAVFVAPNQQGKEAIFLSNESLLPLQAVLQVKVMDFAGNIIHEQNYQIKMKPRETRAEMEIPTEIWKQTGFSPKTHVLVLNFIHGNQNQQYLHYFSHPKNLHLPKPTLKYQLIEKAGKIYAEVSTDQLAKNVYFMMEEAGGNFQENYFDLLPGEKRTILLHKKADISYLRSQFRVFHLQEVLSAK